MSARLSRALAVSKESATQATSDAPVVASAGRPRSRPVAATPAPTACLIMPRGALICAVSGRWRRAVAPGTSYTGVLSTRDRANPSYRSGVLRIEITVEESES